MAKGYGGKCSPAAGLSPLSKHSCTEFTLQQGAKQIYREVRQSSSNSSKKDVDLHFQMLKQTSHRDIKFGVCSVNRSSSCSNRGMQCVKRQETSVFSSWKVLISVHHTFRECHCHSKFKVVTGAIFLEVLGEKKKKKNPTEVREESLSISCTVYGPVSQVE